MQQKTFKIIVFCLFLALSISICYVYKSFINLKYHEYIFKLNEDINTLIIGDSRPMSSLDPNIIKHSQNISLYAENYFFTYYKLRRFLLNNSQIKNVIIGFSPKNISKAAVESFLFDEPIEKLSYERYYNLIDYNGKNIIKSFRKNFIKAVLKYEVGIPINVYKDKKFINYLFRKNINIYDFEFIGGFYAGKESNTDIEDVKISINEYFYDDSNMYGGKSNLNIEYLHKIINICSSSGIKIYLYRSPVSHEYFQLIPKESLKDYEEIKNELIEIYKNIELIDLSRMQISKECYGDGDHVNICGSIVTSQIVYSKINKNNTNNYKQEGNARSSAVSPK